MLMRIYHFPQRHLIFVVPAILVVSFVVGLYADTGGLTDTILPATIVMIFATMVGLRLGELARIRNEARLLGTAVALNFLWIPLVAVAIGLTLLRDHPQLFAGLALVALLPTSGMTIAWTGIQRGNVPGAIKLTVSGLVLGAVLTPWYLLVMVGEFVPIDLWETFRTILTVVGVPLVLGQAATWLLVRRYGREHFQRRIKPNMGPLSVWGLLYLVFVSTSARSEMIVDNLGLIAFAIAAVVVFYLANFAVSSLVAVRAFDRSDGIALVNGTALRNLSIALGIAATQFGAEAALLVTIAFMLQYQSIAYYVRIAGSRWFREPATADEVA